MRKSILFFASLLALCACAKIAEEDVQSSEDRIPAGYREVSVPIETEPATKAGTGEFTLANGEKVSVWCTDASNSSNTGFYNFKVKSNGTTVTVQGSIPSTATVGNVALYPASSSHSYSNWHYFFSVDRKKYYTGKSYVPAEIPMYGTKNSSGKFVFTPMTGAVKKEITGIPSSVSKVKVVFTAKNVKVSGTFSVYDGSNYSTWNPVYAETDNEKQYIRYFDVVNGSVCLYIPYAQGTIWGPSTLTVYDYSSDSTGAVLYTDASVGNLAVTRGQINTQPAASLSGGNNGGGGSTELVYKNYSESSSDIKNPERGLYKMVEYKYHKRSGGYTSATTSLTDEYDENNTLVLAQFYLFDYVDSEHIDSNGKSYIRSVLSNVRNSGKKAIVRISYNNEHPSSYHQEPTKDNIKKHLQDLAPIFTDYEDIIYVVQGGFIGTYGEWYYTSYFGPSSGGVDYTIDENTDAVSGFSNRKEVLEAMLAAVPPSRQIALRTPEYKQCYVNPNHVSSWSNLSGFGTEPVNRLAFYNDAFLYGGEDMGTFHETWQRNMWKQQGAYLINGGEAPYSSKNPSQLEGYTYNAVRSAIFDYHYSYLHHDTGHHTNPGSTNPDHGSLLMRHWHEQGWMPDIKKWLGYRLWMENLKITGTDFSSGSTITVRLKIHNSGAAPVINQRPMKLVLIHNGTPVVIKDNCGEIRSVSSGTTQTFTFNVTMPQSAVSGDKLALWLPDQASGLRSRSEYSIRLANSDVSWSNGYNILYTF